MKAKYRIKKCVERVQMSSCDSYEPTEEYPWYYHVYWSVEVRVFLWIWVTVKTYRSVQYDSDRQMCDYGLEQAEALLETLEEEI